MRDPSLRLVYVSVNKQPELREPLTMKLLEMTLREIPKVLGSLKRITLNDLKDKLKTTGEQEARNIYKSKINY